MAHILPFGGDHLAIERLLPWHVTAQLDDADRATVDAHLADCGACRASLALEHRLKADVASLSPQAMTDWAALRDRLDPAPRRRGSWRGALAARGGAWRPIRIARALAMPGAVAAMAAALVLMVMPPDRPAPYRTLGAAPVATAGDVPGNIIVMFRPDATEAGLRGILRGSGARLVDGPTSANAYVLHVAGGRRAAALEGLRAQSAVTLAEPIDPAAAP